MGKRISQFFKKYRIFYVVAWMLVSFVVTFISYDYRTPIFPQWVGYLIITGLAVPVCYFAAYKLTPRYLYHRQVIRFIVYLFLVACLNAGVTTMVGLFIYHLLTGNPIFRSVLYILNLLFDTLFVDIVFIIVSCIVKIISDRYFMEQQMLQIEKEKVSTELNFLRSQVNPHFLFNVMNTIYFQIDKTNTDARLSVEKLSEMLRYQLYECTTDKIQIQKELHYIQNYVAIQTLRMEKESNISLFIDEHIDVFMVAPLLILPIVENAFKHISNFKEPERNKVQLNVTLGQDHTFIVDVVNTYDQANGQKHLLQSGGLGMQNLKRRLELLYPGKHELIINKETDTYQTILKLHYND